MENYTIYITLWIVTTILLTWLLTKNLRSFALNKDIIDIPNERSSHKVPTPRGGGLAIVITFVINLASLYLFGHIDGSAFMGIGGAALAIAITGFIDDKKPLPSKLRLGIHFSSAVWVVAWLGKIPPVTLFGATMDLGIVTSIIAVIYLVWLLNLYNFMDGIDGIASIEALTVCIGGSVLLYSQNSESAYWVLPILLAAGVAGFLIWNWPPARIFMGDVGSAFLGITIGAISLFSFEYGAQLIWSWVILLAVFIIDATVTLLRRVSRGERFDEPHRTHAYQYASRKYGGHKKVTSLVGLINLFWLLPIAALVATHRIDGGIGVIIAYVPLVGLAYFLRAGARELQTDHP